MLTAQAVFHLERGHTDRETQTPLITLPAQVTAGVCNYSATEQFTLVLISIPDNREPIEPSNTTLSITHHELQQQQQQWSSALASYTGRTYDSTCAPDGHYGR